MSSLYRALPAIDTLLKQPAIQHLVNEYGLALITAGLRTLQQQARQFIAQHNHLPPCCTDWAEALHHYLFRYFGTNLSPVFNLTGTVLHTNLGRALLAPSAIEAIEQCMSHATTLEYDLTEGERSHRDHAISQLLRHITGAEAACIVNNNAAAVLLILASLAYGKEVIVSRGELVEIGGAFRIPDVMRQANCQLIEVGTTNRTYCHDYQQAITEQTGLLMKVHTSNYTIDGFTTSVCEAELVQLARDHQLPVVVDLGSGSLVDVTQYDLPAEPMPQALLRAGVDLICFSADKLLGGPQAGIIVGRNDLIEQLQRHPLKRALRVGKLTLAALEATLRLYLNPQTLSQKLPTLRLLTRSLTEIKACAQRLLPKLQSCYPTFTLAIEPCLSQIGSGTLPSHHLPSYAITFTETEKRTMTVSQLAQSFRQLTPAIIGRLQANKLWLDLRCLEHEETFLKAICQ